jgi:ABC-type multidrug transport system ATPase subunit
LLAAGMVQPARGRILLDGRAPFSSASSRRTIGALCADEQLPTARNLGAALELALRARGEARSALSVLDPVGLAHLAARRASDVSAREARALALVLALSHPKPTLLALHEPLALLGIVPERFVLEALAQFAEAGTLVLATASRVEDAQRLGGEVHALERGIWLDSADSRTPLAAITLRVQTPHARRLAALLSSLPEVSAVTEVGASELLVSGADLERVARSVVASARAESIRISALRQDSAALESLAAARNAIAHAFNATRRA